MNAAAKGEVLFFIHADMQLHKDSLEAICKQIETGFDRGGFATIFDTHNEKIIFAGYFTTMACKMVQRCPLKVTFDNAIS